jgi:hypothetical protein
MFKIKKIAEATSESRENAQAGKRSGSGRKFIIQ